MNAIQLLKTRGYDPNSDLNYCTDDGVEYFIGYNKNKAAISAIITDESKYLITKDELKEMALSARIKGIDHVTLFTNYGVEIHSTLEKIKDFGVDKLIKTTEQ